MRLFRFALAAVAALSLAGSALAQAAPDVATSIKPVQSLVAGVMEGVGEPAVILEGAGSPHSYSMRPSDARALQGADLVFWIGPQMETFLAEPLETLAADARVVTLSEAEGLTRLGFREGAFGAHAHEDEHAHEARERGAGDTHFWLDPLNAKVFVREIEEALTQADPAHAQAYRANAEALVARLDAFVVEIGAALEPVRDEPFVVFHDAYRYFEERFGLKAAGAITLNPEIAPGAERVAEIRDRIRRTGVACVFAEPQFEPSLIRVVTEGTQARTGVLDPLGAGLDSGPDLYFELIRAMAASLKDCLSQPR